MNTSSALGCKLHRPLLAASHGNANPSLSKLRDGFSSSSAGGELALSTAEAMWGAVVLRRVWCSMLVTMCVAVRTALQSEGGLRSSRPPRRFIGLLLVVGLRWFLDAAGVVLVAATHVVSLLAMVAAGRCLHCHGHDMHSDLSLGSIATCQDVKAHVARCALHLSGRCGPWGPCKSSWV